MAKKAFLVSANSLGLKFAENDVSIMTKCLKIHDYDVIVPEVNKGLILEQFDDFIDNCQKTDTIIFYFSGHGLVSRGKLHLVLSDDLSKKKNKINISTFTNAFDDCVACNKLIILDCCHAGATIVEWSPDPTDFYRILTASDRLEKTKELEELKASFLTYKIHQALSSMSAEIMENNKIWLVNLYSWLVREAEKNNFVEHSIKVPIPNLFGNAKANFEIASITQAPLRNVEIIDSQYWKMPVFKTGSNINIGFNGLFVNFDQVFPHPYGRIIYIEGPAGSGKTKIMELLNIQIRERYKKLTTKLIRLEMFISYIKKDIPWIRTIIEDLNKQESQNNVVLLIDSLDELLTGFPEYIVHKWLKETISYCYLFHTIFITCRSNTLISEYVKRFSYLNNIVNLFEVPMLTEKEMDLALEFLCVSDHTMRKKIIAYAQKLNLKSFGDLKIILTLNKKKSMDRNYKYEVQIIVDFLMTMLREVQPIESDITSEDQLRRLGYLAYKIRSGIDIYSISDKEKMERTNNLMAHWIQELNRAGILKLDQTVLFSSERFSDAAMAYSLLIDIANSKIPFYKQDIAYLSRNGYVFAGQLLAVLGNEKDFISKAKNLGGNTEFALACTFCHHPFLPFDIVKTWLERCPYIRIKQRLAHCLYINDDKKSYQNFLISTPATATEKDQVPLEHPLIIHEPLPYHIDEQTAQICIDNFKKKPILRRYIASHLSNAKYYNASDILLKSIEWPDLKGRERRYVIAAIGYLGEKKHIKILKKHIKNETGIFRFDIEKTIDMIIEREKFKDKK